jgi:hypothetical protein
VELYCCAFIYRPFRVSEEFKEGMDEFAQGKVGKHPAKFGGNWGSAIQSIE